MSGHSKWSQIKRKKAKIDAARGKLFTKMLREITVAAREGGGDPAGNARLRLLIEKGKEANMPADNIARAIKKGSGELGGVNYEPVVYEGYGPGGVAIIIEALTDNRNRTVSDLRHAFTKGSGNLAESGAVAWMFEHRGIVVIAANHLTEEAVLEALLEHDIEDVAPREGEFSIQCAIKNLEAVKKAAQAAGFKVLSADIEWIAKDPVPASSVEEEEKVYKLLEQIEDLDDVQNVYSNLP